MPRQVANGAYDVPCWADSADVARQTATPTFAIVLTRCRLQPFAHACGMPRLVAVLAKDFVREEDAVRLMMVVSAAPLADLAVTALSLSLATALSPIALALAFSFAIRFSSACFDAALSTSFAISQACHRYLDALSDRGLVFACLHLRDVGRVVIDEAGNCLLTVQGGNPVANFFCCK